MNLPNLALPIINIPWGTGGHILTSLDTDRTTCKNFPKLNERCTVLQRTKLSTLIRIFTFVKRMRLGHLVNDFCSGCRDEEGEERVLHLLCTYCLTSKGYLGAQYFKKFFNVRHFELQMVPMRKRKVFLPMGITCICAQKYRLEHPVLLPTQFPSLTDKELTISISIIREAGSKSC